jgi:hypothetical protein
MIIFKEQKEINKKKWDACITNSSTPSIFAYTWYLDIVCSNWAALVLGDYEAVFPLAPKTKYKIQYLYQPFFTRYFGVFSEFEISTKITLDFFNAIPQKFKYIEFSLQEEISFQSNEYEFREKKFQILDLNQKYETIQQNFSENSKRNVKKAIKAGLKIRPDISPDKIVNLFKLTKGNELEIFNSDDYTILIALMNKCIDLKKGQSIAIYDGDELCAAAFFMFSGNRFTFLKSGVTEKGKSKGAMHLLFDYFIRANAEKKYQLDFGGSSIETVARFYKNFGAKDCVYLHVKRNNLPKVVQWIKSLKK